jgi:hypothetical protein
MDLTPFIMPWFEGLPEDVWEKSTKLWEKFSDAPSPERPCPDMGLALMMVPLISPLILEPYKESLPEGEKNYLPDMKYFLSCEPMRNFYLRNLRISRAQTDHVIRALFYFSRMTGLWLEQGPPRRIIGKLFQHPPALLAARMARVALELDGKDMPDWMKELAEFDPNQRRQHRSREEGDEHRDRGERGERRDRGPRPRSENSENRQEFSDDPTPEASAEERPAREDYRENARPVRLPPPDKPMVWNGPLHAPVLRPAFSEDVSLRWARKNQTVRAYRPSGIPNPPTDYSLLKSNLVYNYKPEIEGSPNRQDENQERGGERGERGRGGRGGRGRDNKRRGGRERGERPRGGDRGEAAPRSAEEQEQENFATASMGGNPPKAERARPVDDDSIGNIRRPGEQPAALTDAPSFSDEDDIDDNIGNRLDAPPTSGHIGMNGEGVVGSRGGQRGHSGPRRGPGGGSGSGGSGGNRRRGRRRTRRGGTGGGGSNRGAPPRSSFDGQ